MRGFFQGVGHIFMLLLYMLISSLVPLIVLRYF